MAKIIDLVVKAISLVDRPANKKPLYVKSAEGDYYEKSLRFDIRKKDAIEGIAYGVIYEPDAVDTQGDWADAETIRRASHDFMEMGRQNEIDIMHDGRTGKGVLIESSILRAEDPHYPGVKIGAWVGAIKMKGEALARLDEIGGFSLEGRAHLDFTATPPLKKSASTKKNNTDTMKITLSKIHGLVLGTLMKASGKSDVDVAKAVDMKIEKFQGFIAGADDAPVIELEEDQLGDVLKSAGIEPLKWSAALIKAEEDARVAEEAARTAAEPEEEDDDDEVEEVVDGKQKSTPKGKLSKREIKLEKRVKELEKMSIQKGKQENAGRTVHILKVDEGTKVIGDRIEKAEVDKMTTADKCSHIMKAFIKPERIEAIRKSNNLDVGDLSPGGTLTAAQTDMLISLMVDQSAFLKAIQVVKMKSTKQDVNVFDMTGRKMTRQASGYWPTDDSYMSKSLNKSLTMNAAKGSIFTTITTEMLLSYQNLAQWEQQFVGALAMQMANELVDGGFNMNADTAGATNTWASLAKGWIKRCLESCEANQIIDISTGGYTTPQEILDAVIAAGYATSPRFFTEATPLILSSANWDTHEKNLLDRMDATPILVNGAEKKYRGRPVSTLTYPDVSTYLQTELKNLVLGVCGGDNVGMSMQVLDVPDGKLIINGVFFDYELVNYQGATVTKA